MISGSQTGGANDGEVELNLAPIIDCFTVLITYLLVAASYISLGFIDVVAPVPAAQAAMDVDDVHVALHLDTTRSMQIRVGDETFDLPSLKGAWDLEALKDKLRMLTDRHKSLKGVNVSAGDELEYEELIRVVESARTSVPAVALVGQTI